MSDRTTNTDPTTFSGRLQVADPNVSGMPPVGVHVQVLDGTESKITLRIPAHSRRALRRLAERDVHQTFVLTPYNSGQPVRRFSALIKLPPDDGGATDRPGTTDITSTWEITGFETLVTA